MDEQTRAKITELLLQQVAIDEAKEHQCNIVCTAETMGSILKGAIKAGYSHIHPAWAIPLYLSRN